MPDDLFPVTWAGRRAIVSFPGQVGISNVDQLRDRLLSVINRGATVLKAPSRRYHEPLHRRMSA